ncbi:MAG: electron transport complex subunit RsxG [Chromatiales bacterium]|jgi:electron transport complex protein RnfG
MVRHPISLAALILSGFAIVGTTLVAFTHEVTKARIAENEKAAMLANLNALVPPTSVNNDMLSDIMTVSDPELLGAQQTQVYRGRKDSQPVAVVLDPVVPDGYSGPIRLLVAVRYDGTLGGVRVLSHKETPGLGDKIELSRSDWILGFDDKSLGNPPMDEWKVKRDGGVFDQFTGATITPRSIVKAVKNTLIYVQEHHDALYDRTSASDVQEKRDNS